MIDIIEDTDKLVEGNLRRHKESAKQKKYIFKRNLEKISKNKLKRKRISSYSWPEKRKKRSSTVLRENSANKKEKNGGIQSTTIKNQMKIKIGKEIVVKVKKNRQ